MRPVCAQVRACAVCAPVRMPHVCARVSARLGASLVSVSVRLGFEGSGQGACLRGLEQQLVRERVVLCGRLRQEHAELHLVRVKG